MIITMKKTLLLLSSILLSINIIGCASLLSSKSPLPATLNIVSPSPDIPPEIAAFSGIWEGKWGDIVDTIIVVEKIDNQKAELLFSRGCFEKKAGSYHYYTASVLPGPIIEWRDDVKPASNPDGEYQCPCKLTIEATQNKDMLIAYWEWIDHKVKNRADLRRRK